jgi:anthranilate synthase component 1
MTPHRKKLELKGDAIDVFERLAAGQDYCFLLETLKDKDQPQTSSQSYIGIVPKRIFTAKGDELFIDDKKQTVKNPYYALRDYVQTNRSLPAGYIGGLVGYFSHEGVNYLEPTLQFDYQRRFPDFQFGEYRDGVIFAPDGSVEYFYHDNDRSDLYQGETAPQTHLDITFERAEKTEARHADMVEKARGDIINGRVFQVVLANKYHYGFVGDLLQLYRSLREVNPSPFMFFMKFGDVITLGASPELLAHTKPDGRVYLEALAGTIRRGKTPEEDKRLRAKLLADKKEIAEHAMLVDLARNDVGRISQIGSVRIDNLMYVKRLSHVQHICSIVHGQLANGYDMFDSLAASFPAGTLSGAPKIEAIKLIAELERSERGPYGGTIGYFSYNGDSMHAVNIRSVSAVGQELQLHSGSGIVYDSKPAREYEEINEKKAAMMRAMEPFLQGDQR